ncbi:MAG: LysR family transcriptional regulator, partial [Proteobacteria bacterium]|nr:LysR family transcriptional regulator [Pseudomonadota bacterium]
KALKVRGLNLKRNFYLTRHKDRSSSPIGRVFMEFIQKAAKPH